MLKGQCHEIFCFWFFSWISFPPAPEYSIKTVSNFFENSRRYSQVNVSTTPEAFFPTVSLVLLIPVANLPPVSTIPAANLQPMPMTLTANCHRYQQHRRQLYYPKEIMVIFLIEDFFFLPPVSTTPVVHEWVKFSGKIKKGCVIIPDDNTRW